MINKVNTSWLRAVTDNKITSAFQDAWAVVINAIEGNWGITVNEVLPNESVEFKIIKSEYKGSLFTTSQGDLQFTLPFKPSKDSIVEINYYDTNNQINTIDKYIIEEDVFTIQNIQAGDKLITFTGTTRRI